MIRIVNVDKYYNRFHKNRLHVINHTSLEIKEKGLVALLGPSGSGKTTLLNVIGGLDKVGKGKIYVNGQKMTTSFQGKIDRIGNLNIGYIFQDYKLIENKSVYENVAISLKLIGIKDKKEIEKRVCYVLEKVGMLRFKRRPCNTLSGGERQRVGIARAIVKNPNIIIADEPTGNLDSKNSLEIMNIIKAISKEKLVILVTHERNLAEFFASRIIEIEDGKVVKDYENENERELDYAIQSNIYLKDFKEKQEFGKINIYKNDDEEVSLNIVVKNNNIYIESKDHKKIEVVDEDSNITMIDDHYKNISKEEINRYEFDRDRLQTDSKKLKYSSIFNLFTFWKEGFEKVWNYSFLKKILLFGFFLSSIFVVYAYSSMKAAIKVDETDFIKQNKNYVLYETKKINLDLYHKLENDPDILYVLPKKSQVSIPFQVDDFYQLLDYTMTISGSITSLETITKEDIVKGKFPENKNEIVVDRMVIKNILNSDQSKMMGLLTEEDMLDRVLTFNVMEPKKIVGITNLKSPSIYVEKEEMLPVMYYTRNNREDEVYYLYDEYDMRNRNEYNDYHYFLDEIEIKEGRLPENDYETIVRYDQKDSIKLNSNINHSINDHKLVVVGYYTSKKYYDAYFVNTNTLKTYFIETSSNISIYPKDKEKVLAKLKDEYQIHGTDSYEISKKEYMKKREDKVNTSLTAAGIVLAISLIEIFLMIRSSFLSRIKEIGIYRAIGVKKKDIYRMFSGEILAITTISSIPGVLLMSYLLGILSKTSMLKDYIAMSPGVVIISIITVYSIHILAGLIPVFRIMRKRPAQILARTDIE